MEDLGVKDYLTKSSSDTLSFLLPLARVTQLIRGFGSSWKSSVESLSQDVMRSFTNFRNGTSIIQVTCGSRASLPPQTPITSGFPWAQHLPDDP